MNEHLTQQQIENHCRQRLSAAELLAVTDHLSECQACREQVEMALGGDAAFFALRAEIFAEAAELPPAQSHPTSGLLADYVDGALAGEQLQTVADHLRSCELCTLTVDDLRDFSRQIAPGLEREYQPAAIPAAAPASASESRWRLLAALLPSPLLARPALLFGSALAIILLAAAGWLIWQTRDKRDAGMVSIPPPATPQPTSTITPAATVAPALAQLNDGEGRIVLDGEGRLSGVEHMPVAYQQMVKEALSSGQIEKSPLLAGLTRPPSALMGGGAQGNQYSLIDPIGKVVLSDRPTFRWSKLSGASAYVVEVYDESFNPVAESPQITDEQWRMPQPLNRGESYSWQVKAIKDGQELLAPRPPAPQAKFRILDRAKASEIARARQAHPSTHLLLGLLYARAGLLDEAEGELRALQTANPNSEIAGRLLQSVRAMRR